MMILMIEGANAAMSKLTCLLIGYLLGSCSPASVLSKMKHINLRELGTKNLGASNVMLTIGKGAGALVMILDIAKAVIAGKIAQYLFPALKVAGMLACLGAVLGHIYPFHLSFRGGKGMAAFGGMAFFYDPVIFLMLLVLVCILMLIVNYSFVTPITAGILFPLLVALTSGDAALTLIAAEAGILIICKHWSNIGRAKQGQDVKIRDLVTGKLKT